MNMDKLVFATMLLCSSLKKQTKVHSVICFLQCLAFPNWVLLSTASCTCSHVLYSSGEECRPRKLGCPVISFLLFCRVALM